MEGDHSWSRTSGPLTVPFGSPCSLWTHLAWTLCVLELEPDKGGHGQGQREGPRETVWKHWYLHTQSSPASLFGALAKGTSVSLWQWPHHDNLGWQEGVPTLNSWQDPSEVPFPTGQADCTGSEVNSIHGARAEGIPTPDLPPKVSLLSPIPP